jgi:Na+-translocating ferredoxin:NAD+ oxidoreductase RnfE subunit
MKEIRFLILISCLIVASPAFAAKYSDPGEAIFCTIMQGFFVAFVFWVVRKIRRFFGGKDDSDND